jgi:DNA-directed RNA polymerase specialized sigma24 family protein
MHQSHAFDALIEKTPAAKALALRLVTETDLLRLKVIARLHARGLPSEIGWSDLLQEAFTRVLDGSRHQPEGLPAVAFLAGVMRSIKAEYWRRARREARLWPKLLADLETVDTLGDEICDPSPNPERCLIAMQEMAVIDGLFMDDNQARQIIAGLLEGRSPEEIRTIYSMSKTGYESTRKRMRRALLREGLRSPQP